MHALEYNKSTCNVKEKKKKLTKPLIKLILLTQTLQEVCGILNPQWRILKNSSANYFNI